MKFRIVTSFGGIHDYVELAKEAEATGWDGIFVWDDIGVGPREVFDPWVALGAMAAVTQRITLGAMMFSLARRWPWKVARETLTLDHLSNGRLVIPVGLAGDWDAGYARVSTDNPARRVRAEKLDECLEFHLAWRGEPFNYRGTHYRATDLQFLPRPVQRPRIPIWTVGAWPHERSFVRSARWDGMVVYDMSADQPEGADIPSARLAEVVAWMTVHRDPSAPFEVVLEGETDGLDVRATRRRLAPLAEAGATWWIESRWKDRDSGGGTILERIRQRPPRL